MLLKSFVVRKIIIGVAFIGGIVASTLGYNFAIASNTAPVPVYETNKNGETFGSGLNAISPETEPILMRASGEDGTLGYVRTSELHGPMPKSPQEALAQQKKDEANGGRKIPLYAVDGKTVIGVFKLDVGKNTEKLVNN